MVGGLGKATDLGCEGHEHDGEDAKDHLHLRRHLHLDTVLFEGSG